MANTNAMLVDATTRHSIFVQRYSGSQLKQMLPYLNRVKKQTAAQLATGDLTDFSRKRLDRLYKEIDGISVQVLSAMGKKLEGNLKSFSSYEADFAARMMTASTKFEFDVPAKNQIHAAVFSDPLFLNEKGINISSALDEFSQKKSQQIITSIQDGVIAGRTNAQMVRDISAVVDTVIKQQLQALVRTVVGHTSAVSSEQVYKENEDILDGFIWSATLDNRTTDICMALDGQFFKYSDPSAPQKPMHFGCRSNRVPVVKKEYSIRGAVEGLTRPAKGPDGPEQNVPSRSTYSEWLKTQPASFQDEILGPTKGILFREGGLKLDKFVDRDYQPLTIDKWLHEQSKGKIEQLRALDDKYILTALKKAGME